MPVSLVEAYWLAITQIEAEQAILDLQIASFPNMNKTERTKTLAILKANMKFVENSREPVMTLEDLARKMAGGGP